MQQRIDATPEGNGPSIDAGDRFARKARIYVSLVDNPGTVQDPAPHLKDPDDFNNPNNRPGRFHAPRPMRCRVPNAEVRASQDACR